MSPSLPRLHRTVALLVVAVVVALVLLLTLLAGNRDQPERERPGPAVLATVSPSATQPVTGTGLRRPRLAELPVGPPPGIPYVEDHVYVTPDGTRVPLRTSYGIHAVVPWNDGFLVADTRWFEGTNGLTHVTRGGRVVGSWPTSGAPVAAPDGRVAWTQVTVSEASNPRPAVLFVGHPDGRVVRQRLRPGVVSVVGFAGRFVVLDRFWHQGYYVTDLEHPPQRLPGRIVRGEPRLPSLAWEVGQRVREDRRHVLAVAVDGRRIAVVRVATDGTVERVTPIRRLRDPLDPPYVLTTRP